MTSRVEVAEEPLSISPSVDPKLVGIRGWLKRVKATFVN